MRKNQHLQSSIKYGFDKITCLTKQIKQETSSGRGVVSRNHQNGGKSK